MSDHTLNAEKALLGLIILDNRHYDEAAQQLRAEDFAVDSHRRIFRRIAEMLDDSRGVDSVTLLNELARHVEIEAVGGAAYVASLTEGVPRRPAVDSYVQIVDEAARRRRTHKALQGMVTEVEDLGEDVNEMLARGVSQMLELQSTKQESATSAAIVPLLDRMKQEHTRKSDLLGLPTGLQSLDLLTRGMQPSELIVVGARSGVGKSSFMLQAAMANCQAGNGVLLFSLEMTREQLLRRMLASVAQVPFVAARDTKWASDSDMAKLEYAAQVIADWPLEIDSSGAIHIDKLGAKARHAIRRNGVKLVCVDYAQIVPADGRDERLRVAAVSRGATRLAKDEGVPVMLLSQLSRPDKANANRRPRLSDLRETSQLENDANVAVLLHRPVDDEEQPGSAAELIVAKQRSGATGVFPLEFNQRSLMFEERKSDSARRAVAS